MPTLPTAFAETTKRSLNNKELGQRVLGLYRKYLRSAPVFIELYELDLPIGVVRTKIRQEFERNRFQKDININNVLLAKGQMEYQELINFWKQNAHVMRYFEHEGDTRFSTDARLTDSFVGKFLKGY
ncbi:NADH-ubiquinone oxidoreductase [Wickerhamomyces ciferrii]|uniref:NADH-ubiquinone oxidoreductase n=1 Tax=Wickerhamomyces ciferrii (strain ATCC 14091 / BCRC 22168 / CBS 111 / JCM 3599 / NBRC 0793 / NRRL Y-1031 F-60-10) TaxID=1206466 RepID=K0KY00_WICCF|nr:NADH-ubiquinone oxidoreductase [Wickerhamomyces ciferrii]CCH46324.1 NADH-ubiquinone oxidoreductase [Wickerhamomyces ciferrii]